MKSMPAPREGNRGGGRRNARTRVAEYEQQEAKEKYSHGTKVNDEEDDAMEAPLPVSFTTALSSRAVPKAVRRFVRLCPTTYHCRI